MMYLQQFDFEITHRPGKENKNADALSRVTINHSEIIDANDDLDARPIWCTAKHAQGCKCADCKYGIKQWCSCPKCNDPRYHTKEFSFLPLKKKQPRYQRYSPNLSNIDEISEESTFKSNDDKDNDHGFNDGQIMDELLAMLRFDYPQEEFISMNKLRQRECQGMECTHIQVVAAILKASKAM
jgi:hypothetical protein